MKHGLSLVQLATEIDRQAGAKKDFVASASALTAEVVGNEVKLNIGADHQYPINDIAHNQIAGHLEIPAAYYNRMKTDDPDLLAINVNCWLSKSDKKRLVRTLDGKVRAFPSDSYRPLENDDLAHAVFPVLQERQLAVVSSQITEKRLYIKVVDNSVLREIPEGISFGDGAHHIVRNRQLFPALTISNSEVSHGSLSIQAGVYDGFCTNLAFFGERSLKKYHVGGKHEIAGEALYGILSDQTRKLTDVATWAQVRDVVAAAFDEAKFDALVAKIAGTIEAKIQGDPIKVVELAAKKFGINEGERKSVLDHLIKGAAFTQFGLYNAITRTAEDLNDYDRATEFESLGAKVIELDRKEWQTLALAA